MIGSNSMDLNEATMKEIVQFWLDNKFLNKDASSPKVTGIQGVNSGGSNCFRVALEKDPDNSR